MLLAPLTYPAAFTGQEYSLCLPAELLRPVLGKIAELRHRSYWATETDWLLGQQLILEIEMSVACNNSLIPYLDALISAIHTEGQATRREIRLARGVRAGPVSDPLCFQKQTTELLGKGVDYADMDPALFASLSDENFFDPVEAQKGAEAWYDRVFKGTPDATHKIEDALAFGDDDDAVLALAKPTGVTTHDVIEFLGVKLNDQHTFIPAQMCLIDVAGGVKTAISAKDVAKGKTVTYQGDQTVSVKSLLFFKQTFYGALKLGAVFRSLRGIDFQVKLTKGSLNLDRGAVQIRAASDICSFVYELDSTELTTLEAKPTVAEQVTYARALLQAKEYL